MRKTILLLPVLLAGMFFYSCQKETSNDSTNKEIVSKVNAWLDKKKPANKVTQSENVELLKRNLDYPSLRIEQSADNEKIIVIPVMEELKEKKNLDKKAIPNLVLIQDNMGNVRKGNIVLYMPASGEAFDRLPDNTFYNILNTGKPETNGKFKYLSVTGKGLHELNYDNGKLKSFGYLKDSSSTGTRSNDNCVDWYWVTTVYDEWGYQISQTWDYYGTTCQGEDCEDPYNVMLCPMDGSSGGGTGDAEGWEYAVSKPWKFPVDFLYDGSLVWLVKSYETISGVKKSGETCGGHFTSITHENSYLDYGQGYTWEQIGNTVSINNPCEVQSYITGKVTRNSNGNWTTHEKQLKTWFDFEFQ